MKISKALSGIALVALALLGSCDAATAAPAPTTLVGYIHDFDAGYAIGGETDPYGWVVSPDARNVPVSLRRTAYLEAAHPGIDFARFAGVRCVLQGVLVEDGLSAGGVETPYRTFDLLRVETIAKAPDRIPVPPPRPAFALIRRLRADLVRLGVDFDVHGTAEPQGGLSPDGVLDGRLLPALALEVPPEGSADMHTVLAFVDRPGRRYWAHRTGGFVGVSQWVGPFRLPRAARRSLR
jgi:hypothetical protein